MNIGILGLGAIAQEMARTISRMDDVTLYGVAARDINKAVNFAKRFGVAKAYGSYEDLAEDADIDLIYIATPHSYHYEHAKMCVEHGRAVLVEKSFTVNQTEAEDLISLAVERGVFLCEAMWVRFLPMAEKLQKLLDKEPIGEIVAVSANLGYELTHKERVVEPVLAGGALLDVGIYPLTFATMVLGYDISYLSTSVVKLDSGVDAQESISLTYSNGAMANLYSTMLANTDRRGVIYGTEGYIEVDNINNFEAIRLMDGHHNCIEEIRCEPQITGYEYEVRACCKAIAEGELECEQMPHSLTIRMMQIMDAIRRQWGLVYPSEEEQYGR
jgi:predicted dehydrogenase